MRVCERPSVDQATQAVAGSRGRRSRIQRARARRGADGIESDCEGGRRETRKRDAETRERARGRGPGENARSENYLQTENPKNRV